MPKPLTFDQFIMPENPFRQIQNARLSRSDRSREGDLIYGEVFDANGTPQLDLRRSGGRYRYVDEQAPNKSDCLYLKEAIYCGHYHYHYGHFLIETLTSTAVAYRLREKGLKVPMAYHIFSGRQLGAEERQSFRCKLLMDAFCLSGEEIYDIDESHMVDRLHCFERPFQLQRGEVITDFGADFQGARERLLKANGIEQDNRRDEIIYLSRQTAHAKKAIRRIGSHVLDEPEFEEELKKRGVRVLVPDHLPMAEQIALWKRSKMIIALTGSGLHNILWCQPGTHMVDLVTRPKPAPLMEKVCSAAGGISHQVSFQEGFFREEGPNGVQIRFNIEGALAGVDRILSSVF